MIVKRRTTYFFIVSVFAFVSLLFTGVAIATNFWVVASLERDTTQLVNSSFPLQGYLGENPIDEEDPGAFRGLSYFGLFQGCKRFNYGIGGRELTCYKVFDEHSDVYSIGFPIAVFIFMLIALIFSLVSTIFGLVNTLTVPIETIHGPMGLYLWNAIGALACLMAWVLYLILYLTQLTTNVLTKEDMNPPKYFRTYSVSFGYSYWLVIASFLLLLVNIVFVFLAHRLQNPDFLRRQKQEADIAKGTNVGLGLMY